jgi:hypothetical protein
MSHLPFRTLCKGNSDHDDNEAVSDDKVAECSRTPLTRSARWEYRDRVGGREYRPLTTYEQRTLDMPRESSWKRWIGFGVKSGGQLLIGGVESIIAYMVNLGSGETFDLKIINSRWGIGLGGSGGVVVILGWAS